MYLPLYKVADTPFHIQGDEIIKFFMYHSLLCMLLHVNNDQFSDKFNNGRKIIEIFAFYVNNFTFTPTTLDLDQRLSGNVVSDVTRNNFSARYGFQPFVFKWPP